MKVAFFVYPSAFQNPGGGEIQLLKTKEGLEGLGVEVCLFDQWRDKLEDYDVLHVFGSVKDCAGLMATARNKGVPVALSSIFWSSFNRAINEGGTLRSRAELVARHVLKVLMPYLPTGRRKTMTLADIILPNSESEKQQLMRLFGIPGEKIIPVPNAIDERFLEASADEFMSEHGIKDFVLAVGRIEPRKNQLNLIKAMNGVDRELVIVGDPVSDFSWYYDECRKAAGDNVQFIGRIDHDSSLLSSAYASCSVFVAPGWFETPGLAALEAAAGGAAIAITSYGSTRDYFGNEARYFDPASPRGIKAAVIEALDVTGEQKGALRERIRTRYLWEHTAERTIAAYKKIVKEKT